MTVSTSGVCRRWDRARASLRRDALRTARPSSCRDRETAAGGAARRDGRHPAGAHRARRRGGHLHRPARRAAGRGARARVRAARRRGRRGPLRRQARPARRGRRVQLAADGLAGPRRPALLHGHRRVAGGHAAGVGTCAPAVARSPASTTRSSTSTPPAPPGVAQASGLTSEAALLAAVGASRTGRMADIVATIQAEQDEIIRSKPSGVLVVQGGPGTGKTAVALHRAAYLLYTHRDRLARRGVLVVGPNPTFLRYIGQVLPSLGETSVVLSTVGQLFPGLDARRPEPPEVAEVKGRAEMAGVIAAAVRDRQQLPRRPVQLVVEQQAGARRPRGRQRRPHPGPPLAQAAQRRQADLPPGGHPAAGRAGRALDRARRAAAARRGRPRRYPRRAEGEPRARPRARRAVAHAVGRAAPRRPLRRPAAPRGVHPAPARRRPRAAGPAAARRRRAGRPALDPGRRAAARRGRRAARRRRRRGRRPRGRRTARGGHVRPRRARRARPGGGPRPRAAARHRRDRRRPARRAPGRAPLRLHGRPGRRRPRVDLRARDRRRGAGAVGHGVAAGDAPVPHAVDDAGGRHRADRRPRGCAVLGRGAVAVRGEPVAAGRAHGQLPHARGDRRGGRRPAGRDRARPGAAAFGAHAPGCRRGPSRWSPGRWTRRSRRSPPRRRAPWGRAAPPCWPRPPAWRACATG